MSMSKQDFIALADALRSSRPIISNVKSLLQMQWENDVSQVAEVCRRANPAFKRERWLAYIAGECGPNGGERYISCQLCKTPVGCEQEAKTGKCVDNLACLRRRSVK